MAKTKKELDEFFEKHADLSENDADWDGKMNRSPTLTSR